MIKSIVTFHIQYVLLWGIHHMNCKCCWYVLCEGIFIGYFVLHLQHLSLIQSDYINLIYIPKQLRIKGFDQEHNRVGLVVMGFELTTSCLLEKALSYNFLILWSIIHIYYGIYSPKREAVKHLLSYSTTLSVTLIWWLGMWYFGG